MMVNHGFEAAAVVVVLPALVTDHEDDDDDDQNDDEGSESGYDDPDEAVVGFGLFLLLVDVIAVQSGTLLVWPSVNGVLFVSTVSFVSVVRSLGCRSWQENIQNNH